MFNLGILTCSDMGSLGERIDTSGPAIKEALEPLGFNVVHYEIVKDDIESISTELIAWADSRQVDLIITTGGTGLGPRDVTPEATKNVLDRLSPGLDEAIRRYGEKNTPFAVLSRGISGVRGHCLIINIPGNPSAVKDAMEVLTGILPHAMDTLTKWKVEEHPKGL